MSVVRIRPLRAAFAAWVFFAAAASAAEISTGDSLYARLGGEQKVSVFVGETIDTASTAPDLKRSFKDVDLPRVKTLIVEQICHLSGGGCKYTGDSMRDVHAGLGITQAEMYRLVEVLREAMRRNEVPLQERNELLALLAPMKRDVVEK